METSNFTIPHFLPLTDAVVSRRSCFPTQLFPDAVVSRRRLFPDADCFPTQTVFWRNWTVNENLNQI